MKSERKYPSLIARLASGNQEFMDVHLVRSVGGAKARNIRPEDRWLRRGMKLQSLAELVPAIEAMDRRRNLSSTQTMPEKFLSSRQFLGSSVLPFPLKETVGARIG